MTDEMIRKQALVVSLAARMYALNATIDGMNIKNAEMERDGLAHAWPQSSYDEISEELVQISQELLAIANVVGDE